MCLHAVLPGLYGRTGHHVTRYQAMAMVKPFSMRSLPMKLALSAADRVDILTSARHAAEPFAVSHNIDESST